MRKQDVFLIVNRELEHLRKSTVSYIQKQKLTPMLRDIHPNQWKDYTDCVKQGQQKKSPGNHSNTIRTHKKRVQARKGMCTHPIDFEFSWPVSRSLVWLSSLFGPRKEANGRKGFHGGIDMAACKGTPVYASAPGIVVETKREKDSGGWGNTIVIAHNRKYRTRYAHLHTISVQVGEHVSRGHLIGTVGDTGRVRSRGKDASHLHFELSIFGKKVNPLAFLS